MAKLFFSIVLTLFSLSASGETAIGLYEGLLGNSGTALADPTAASYYNPSLLSRKIKDSYSLSGNTLGSFSSKSSEAELTSFALNPGYLSTVLVGTALVHEMFIVNTSPSKVKVVTNLSTLNLNARYEQTRDQNQFLFGYSMAFRSIPFALSYFGQFTQIDAVGFRESTSLNSNLRSTDSTKLDFKSMGVGVSVSGHTKVNDYTLGYHFRSRQLSVYRKDQEQSSSFVHGGTTPTDYVRTESTFLNQNLAPNGSSVTIGHGFVAGDHEFTTDSRFVESNELNSTYTLTQTFGYRMNSRSGHQFLCGLSHELSSNVKYFGQSAYYSVGYSWLKNSLRTVLGTYVYTSRISQDIFAAGLTFGSEFSY